MINYDDIVIVFIFQFQFAMPHINIMLCLFVPYRLVN
jgi:hypothetical protein